MKVTLVKTTGNTKVLDDYTLFIKKVKEGTKLSKPLPRKYPPADYNFLSKKNKQKNNSTGEIIVNQECNNTPLTGTNFCQQMISRLCLAYGASATGTLNTGSAASLAKMITTKSSTQTIYTRHEIEVIGA
jgi:hypothetical protein